MDGCQLRSTFFFSELLRQSLLSEQTNEILHNKYRQSISGSGLYRGWVSILLGIEGGGHCTRSKSLNFTCPPFFHFICCLPIMVDIYCIGKKGRSLTVKSTWLDVCRVVLNKEKKGVDK